MVRGTVRAIVAGAATAAVASCGGGGANAGASAHATATPTPTSAVVTPPSESPHDLAVAIRKVTGEAATEIANTSSDLQNSPTLDVAAQTMGGHAAYLESLHQTLEQLPAAAPQIQAHVYKLSVDLDSLSGLISAMVAAEVSQYGQFRSRINAQFPVVSQDITTVNADVAPF